MLRVGAIADDTEAEGPGRRFALWVQGCSLRCPGCCNPELFDRPAPPFGGAAGRDAVATVGAPAARPAPPFGGAAGRDALATVGAPAAAPMTVDEVVARIAASSAIEGISLLGGEPTEQADDVAAVARAARARGLTVMLYSGYTLAELHARGPAVEALLAATDLLVDGRYDRTRPEPAPPVGRRWIGSANQELHFLSAAYSAVDPQFRGANTVEIHVRNGQVLVNGWPAGAAALLGEAPMSTAERLDDVRPLVSPTEHLIITMARVLVGGPATTDLATLLAIGHAMPAQVSPACADLVEDALRQVWSTLALRGGALPAKHLTASGGIVDGRVWQRHRPLPLAFTAATLAILRWLVGAPLATLPVRAPPLDVPSRPLEAGDQLVVFLALDALAPYHIPARAFAAQPLVRATPLAWLACPGLLATAEAPTVPSFEPLVASPGAAILEALAPELARRWREAELAKRAITRPESMLAIGAAQDAVIGGLLQACHAARRRDLAGWLLDAAAPLLANDRSPAPVRLDPAASLGSRARARVAAGSLLRAVAHWTAWDQEHRGVRFFDEDYAIAQVLLARFEVVGPVGAARAARWLHELGSLGMLDAT